MIHNLFFSLTISSKLVDLLNNDALVPLLLNMNYYLFLSSILLLLFFVFLFLQGWPIHSIFPTLGHRVTPRLWETACNVLSGTFFFKTFSFAVYTHKKKKKNERGPKR